MYSRIVRIDKNVSQSVGQLTATTAELIARVNASEDEMRRLSSLLEENQVKLQDIERTLNQLANTIHNQWQLTPPNGAFTQTPVPEESVVAIAPPPAPITVAPVENDVSSIPPTPARPTAVAPPREITGADTTLADPAIFYQQAYNVYRSDDWTQAFDLFDAFIRQFPNSDRVGNAHFYKGRCYLKQEKFQEAIREYQVVIDNYPRNTKVPLAMQNQAFAYTMLGQRTKAEALLVELIDNYPVSPEAEQAQTDLQRLRGN
jgi:tol-pal system protein YbgF